MNNLTECNLATEAREGEGCRAATPFGQPWAHAGMPSPYTALMAGVVATQPVPPASRLANLSRVEVVALRQLLPAKQALCGMVSRGLSQNPPPYAALAAGVVAAQPLLPRTTSRFGWLTLLFLAATLGFGPLALRAEPAANSSAPEATTYQIRNVKFGDLLRPRDANNANGTRLVLYPAQPWKCMTWRLQPAGESAFQVKNLFTAKTFGADAGTNAPQPKVTQLPLPKDGVDAPLWQFVRLADNSYKIIDAKSSQALTATKAEGGYEAKIVTSAWADLPEQKWQLEKMDPKELTM